MKTFTIKRRINFYDCDPAGIIFYSRVFEFAHSAYEQLIQSIEKNEDYWNNNKYIVPIIKTEANYIKPIKNEDEITINVKLNQLRSSSFELQYEMLNESDEPLCNVKTVHVFVNKQSWEKMDMPGNIKRGLEIYN